MGKRIALLCLASLLGGACGKLNYDPGAASAPDADPTSPDASTVPTACRPALDDDTVAYYTMDDLGAGTAADSTGTHPAIVQGSPESRPGPAGCGSAFQTDNGTYIEIPHSEDFDERDGAVDFWLYLPTTLPASGAGLVSRDEDGIDTDGHLTIWITEAGEILVRLQSLGDEDRRCSPALPRETWMHIAVVFDFDNTLLYVDGTEYNEPGSVFLGNTTSCALDGETEGIRGNLNPWVIGAAANQSDEASATPTQLPFNGAIDEFRISSAVRDFAL